MRLMIAAIAGDFLTLLASSAGASNGTIFLILLGLLTGQGGLLVLRQIAAARWPRLSSFLDGDDEWTTTH